MITGFIYRFIGDKLLDGNSIGGAVPDYSGYVKRSYLCCNLTRRTLPD